MSRKTLATEAEPRAMSRKKPNRVQGGEATSELVAVGLGGFEVCRIDG